MESNVDDNEIKRALPSNFGLAPPSSCGTMVQSNLASATKDGRTQSDRAVDSDDADYTMIQIKVDPGDFTVVDERGTDKLHDSSRRADDASRPVEIGGEHRKRRRNSADETHLRHCMLFLFNRGSNASNATKEICDVYGQGALNARTCQHWFAKFRAGDFSLSDCPRSGRPSVIDPDALRAVVESNPRLSAREIAKKLQTSHSTVQTHLKAMGMVSKCGIWMPRHPSKRK